MSRSTWKPIFIHPQIISQFKTSQNSNSKEIVMFNRSTVLTEEFLGYQFIVYNGNRFFSVNVDTDKLGHRIGEFSPSKKKPLPKKKKK